MRNLRTTLGSLVQACLLGSLVQQCEGSARNSTADLRNSVSGSVASLSSTGSSKSSAIPTLVMFNDKEDKAKSKVKIIESKKTKTRNTLQDEFNNKVQNERKVTVTSSISIGKKDVRKVENEGSVLGPQIVELDANMDEMEGQLQNVSQQQQERKMQLDNKSMELDEQIASIDNETSEMIIDVQALQRELEAIKKVRNELIIQSKFAQASLSSGGP